MSDLGEISTEVRAALSRLDRVLNRFASLDHSQLAPLEAQLRKSPQTRQVAALVARARSLLQQARNGAAAARGSGAEWLSQHGSGEAGSSRGSSSGDNGGGSSPFSSTVVEAVWAGGIKTPGGRAYFAAAEPNHLRAAASLAPFPGEYTFDAHGHSDRVEYGDTVLDAAELAELIRADGDWKGRPIRLFSCNTGRGENPIAAELARLTGVRVTAPDDLVWSYSGGEPVVAPIKTTVVNGNLVEAPDHEAEGEWREFYP